MNAEANEQPPLEVVDDITAAILRKKTPQGRLRMAFEMWEMARSIVLGSLRRDHPDWTEEQIQRETACRMSNGALDEYYNKKYQLQQ